MYVLSATDGVYTEYTRIDADNDIDASMQGIFTVLERAKDTKEGLWAMGEINLLSPDGLIIQHLPAKSGPLCPHCGDTMNDGWTDLGCEGDSNG
jgi:hypothetical protein